MAKEIQVKYAFKKGGKGGKKGYGSHAGPGTKVSVKYGSKGC